MRGRCQSSSNARPHHMGNELKTAHYVRGERATKQLCLCNIRRRGRETDVKRESERKEEKFGLLLQQHSNQPESWELA